MQSLLQKNPFSLYDFLGYLFPGVFFLLIISLFTSIDEINWDNIINGVIGENSVFTERITLYNTLFFTIASYIVGQLLSYISTLTVERFSLWLYGYPSEFLLNQRNGVGFWGSCVMPNTTQWKSSNKNWFIKFWKCVVEKGIRLTMSLILFPLSFCSILSCIINFRGFITKPLDENTCKWIYDKNKSLIVLLGHNLDEDVEMDYSRIIYHYYMHKQNGTFLQKIDNYVALYGFLRAITLMLNIVAMYILVYSILNCVFWNNLLLFTLLLSATYISFLAYMKFYRRYTLEIFMFLVSDKELKL